MSRIRWLSQRRRPDTSDNEPFPTFRPSRCRNSTHTYCAGTSIQPAASSFPHPANLDAVQSPCPATACSVNPVVEPRFRVPADYKHSDGCQLRSVSRFAPYRRRGKWKSQWRWPKPSGLSGFSAPWIDQPIDTRATVCRRQHGNGCASTAPIESKPDSLRRRTIGDDPDLRRHFLLAYGRHVGRSSYLSSTIDRRCGYANHDGSSRACSSACSPLRGRHAGPT